MFLINTIRIIVYIFLFQWNHRFFLKISLQIQNNQFTVSFHFLKGQHINVAITDAEVPQPGEMRGETDLFLKSILDIFQGAGPVEIQVTGLILLGNNRRLIRVGN